MSAAGEALPRALGRRRGQRPVRPEELWRTSDAIRAAVLGALGAGGIGVCWYGSAGEDYWRGQLPWLIGAIACTVMGSLGMVSWLLSGFRALRTEEWAAKHEFRAVLATGRSQPAQTDSESSRVVTAQGMTHFHRPTCPLVARKSVVLVHRSTSVELTACGVCNP